MSVNTQIFWSRAPRRYAPATARCWSWLCHYRSHGNFFLSKFPSSKTNSVHIPIAPSTTRNGVNCVEYHYIPSLVEVVGFHSIKESFVVVEKSR